MRIGRALTVALCALAATSCRSRQRCCAPSRAPLEVRAAQPAPIADERLVLQGIDWEDQDALLAALHKAGIGYFGTQSVGWEISVERGREEEALRVLRADRRLAKYALPRKDSEKTAQAPITWEGITGFEDPKSQELQWILLHSDGRAAMEDGHTRGRMSRYLYHGTWEWRGADLHIRFDTLYPNRRQDPRPGAPSPTPPPPQTVEVVVIGRQQGDLWKFELSGMPKFFAADGLWKEKRPEYRNPPWLLQFFEKR